MLVFNVLPKLSCGLPASPLELLKKVTVHCFQLPLCDVYRLFVLCSSILPRGCPAVSLFLSNCLSSIRGIVSSLVDCCRYFFIPPLFLPLVSTMIFLCWRIAPVCLFIHCMKSSCPSRLLVLRLFPTVLPVHRFPRPVLATGQPDFSSLLLWVVPSQTLVGYYCGHCPDFFLRLHQAC